MNERAIQNRLFWTIKSAVRIALPNYTPHGWFESDMWAVTKAGYGVEFEIKLTVADFRADLLKRRPGRWDGMAFTPGQLKAELLAEGHAKGPSRFWYVVPDGLLAPSDLPAWAGLKTVSGQGRPLSIVTRVEAPRLHKEKVSQKVLDHAVGVCYWRFWTERTQRTVG